MCNRSDYGASDKRLNAAGPGRRRAYHAKADRLTADFRPRQLVGPRPISWKAHSSVSSIVKARKLDMVI
jgi:hypothetical protein